MPLTPIIWHIVATIICYFARKLRILKISAVVKMCKITVTDIINKKKTRYQRKLINMNKLRLLIFVLLSAFVIQSCKKVSVSASAASTAPLQAAINGAAWAPDTISNTITYNSATKTKVFNCMGTKSGKQIILTINLNNASNTPGFNTGTFNIDSVTTIVQYNTQQKNSSGAYVFLPQGAVRPGAGTVAISAVDSVKKQITGTFFFYSRTYDNSGIVTSIDVIYGGAFNALPYTYISN